jgi:hypothetical protein
MTGLEVVMPKKAEYLDNRDLALRIISQGFAAVKAEIGERLDPVRAAKIVKMLREDYGVAAKNIDKELQALAEKKRPGHVGGPVTPPAEDEEREYRVGANGRIGVPLKILGKKPGDTAKVRYTKTQITIRS